MEFILIGGAGFGIGVICGIVDAYRMNRLDELDEKSSVREARNYIREKLHYYNADAVKKRLEEEREKDRLKVEINDNISCLIREIKSDSEKVREIGRGYSRLKQQLLLFKEQIQVNENIPHSPQVLPGNTATKKLVCEPLLYSILRRIKIASMKLKGSHEPYLLMRYEIERVLAEKNIHECFGIELPEEKEE